MQRSDNTTFNTLSHVEYILATLLATVRKCRESVELSTDTAQVTDDNRVPYTGLYSFTCEEIEGTVIDTNENSTLNLTHEGSTWNIISGKKEDSLTVIRMSETPSKPVNRRLSYSSEEDSGSDTWEVVDSEEESKEELESSEESHDDTRSEDEEIPLEERLRESGLEPVPVVQSSDKTLSLSVDITNKKLPTGALTGSTFFEAYESMVTKRDSSYFPERALHMGGKNTTLRLFRIWALETVLKDHKLSVSGPHGVIYNALVDVFDFSHFSIEFTSLPGSKNIVDKDILKKYLEFLVDGNTNPKHRFQSCPFVDYLIPVSLRMEIEKLFENAEHVELEGDNLLRVDDTLIYISYEKLWTEWEQRNEYLRALYSCVRKDMRSKSYSITSYCNSIIVFNVNHLHKGTVKIDRKDMAEEFGKYIKF